MRGFIVLVLVIGTGLGYAVRRGRIQGEAVSAIENAGGSVGYESGLVTFVDLRRKSAIDKVIAQAGRLSRLQLLLLDHSSFSDLGLAHLKGLTELSSLDLRYTQVTDAGLVHLNGLTKLSYLVLQGTQVTDAGLVHLKELTRLWTLSLVNTQVTDAGVNDLKRALPHLKIASPNL